MLAACRMRRVPPPRPSSGPGRGPQRFHARGARVDRDHAAGPDRLARGAQNALQAAQADFRASCAEVVELVQQRLVNYELTIRGGAAMFAQRGAAEPAQWQAYVDGLELTQRFPAMTGLGYAAYVSRYDSSNCRRMRARWGRGLFTVWPHGAREHYGPIVYLEPRTAENLNVDRLRHVSPKPCDATRCSRRCATRAAHDRRACKLLQDLDPNRAGFLMYVPVFPRRHRAGDLRRATRNATHRLGLRADPRRAIRRTCLAADPAQRARSACSMSPGRARCCSRRCDLRR
jgi:hypothetical protein